MRRLSSVLQNMVNIYPDFTKVRLDEQSLGQRFLNSVALQVEDCQQELTRFTSGYHLSTINMNEIDQIYKINLGSSFVFTENNSDPFYTDYVTPTMSGKIDSIYYPISLAEQNDIETFWYDHLPDRISDGVTSSGIYELLNDYSHNAPFSGVINPHRDGYLYVQATGGTQYVLINAESYVERAELVIYGTTRKGVEEEEHLVFPWDQKQRTFKEWHSIDKVDCINFPSGVLLNIYSADVANGPYQDFWNFYHSENRKKIDVFWDLDENVYGSTLEFQKYSTDDLFNMLNGIYSIYSARRFELLDTNGNNISDILDIAQEPFTNNIWGVTENKLYCFDNRLTTVEDVTPLLKSTEGNRVAIYFDFDHIVRDEEVAIDFMCRDVLVPIYKYRNTVTYPDSTMSGILSGALVPYDATWTTKESIEDYVDQKLLFETDQLGEHVFTLEIVLSDGTEQTEKRILCVDSKTAYKEFDLPATISGVIGIDFDSEQKPWIYTSGEYHQINFHHDVALIDYSNKEVFVRENYDEVLLW